MTEDEWLHSCQPREMFDSLLGGYFSVNGTPHRKLRLLACAICREAWNQLQDQRFRTAIVIGERYADWNCTTQERMDAWGGANDANRPEQCGHTKLSVLASICAADDHNLVKMRRWLDMQNDVQSDLVREIMGNPFHAYSLQDLWPGSCSTSAQQTCRSLLVKLYYHNTGVLCREHVSVLADFLEEYSVHADLITHLRVSGMHFRGCWVLDILSHFCQIIRLCSWSEAKHFLLSGIHPLMFTKSDEC